MTTDRRDASDKDLEIARHELNQALIESGERDQLKQYVMDQLMRSGWRDELKEYCVLERIKEFAARQQERNNVA
ncbi:conserved hypothetical protein [Perkinsus marinus ATCC 50983]|uniref:Transcription and mRNA export factor ENY2 n=1 Tax=Perkinsus marinus (strain ATCC 50983 / TXsc) TaxID=423536 RepID=C5LBN5_PERM5|nr:conserved hypothetical protein [Perkinsus marinus ATCC 50983]EER05856.1 conserved hypothetical protein [Perkinsus marinus ATCC 50983]|eukprot:XP_002774040.1 conserved hypothetical protein [Perkinsus marinus ATCC 50983]